MVVKMEVEAMTIIITRIQAYLKQLLLSFLYLLPLFLLVSLYLFSNYRRYNYDNLHTKEEGVISLCVGVKINEVGKTKRYFIK